MKLKFHILHIQIDLPLFTGHTDAKENTEFPCKITEFMHMLNILETKQLK